MKTTDKVRWPLEAAILAGRELITRLDGCCLRAEIAGSVRRQKEKVGDMELLFVPRIEKVLDPHKDLFEMQSVNHTERALDQMLRDGVLEKRVNIKGHTSWGPKNKLALHAASGIPIDLFTATPENWWNYLVCRTGPAASNERIAVAAQKRGWKWKPYTCGFCELEDGMETHTFHAVNSEEEVFKFVGLPYQPPEERV